MILSKKTTPNITINHWITRVVKIEQDWDRLRTVNAREKLVGASEKLTGKISFLHSRNLLESPDCTKALGAKLQLSQMKSNAKLPVTHCDQTSWATPSWSHLIALPWMPGSDGGSTTQHKPSLLITTQVVRFCLSETQTRSDFCSKDARSVWTNSAEYF